MTSTRLWFMALISPDQDWRGHAGWINTYWRDEDRVYLECSCWGLIRVRPRHITCRLVR